MLKLYTSKPTKRNFIFTNISSFFLITSCCFLFSGRAEAQWCTATSAGVNACSPGQSYGISYVQVGSTVIYNNGTCVNTAYADKTTSSPSAAVTQGQSYTITVNKTGNTYKNVICVVVDWNNNFTFETGEVILNQTIAAGGANTASTSFTVPNTLTGNIRMRVIVNFSSAPTTPFCTLNQGQAYDFTLVVGASTPCSGTPSPGAPSASPSSVCAGTTGAPAGAVLSLPSLASAGGYTYQWVYTATSGSGYSTITGATNSTYTTPTTLPYTPTYYGCIVTCSNSGLSGQSSDITVNYSSSFNCVCKATYTTGASASDRITGVALNASVNAINDNPASASASPFYTLLSSGNGSSGSPASMSLSTSYTLTVKAGTKTTSTISAWIDFNGDGVFGTATVASGGEFLGSLSSGLPAGGTLTFTVPSTNIITSGNTLLRVVESRTTAPTSSQSCGSFTDGETRDYFVTFTAAACSGTPTAGNVYAGASGTNTTASACPAATQTMFVTGYSTGVSGITFQWQSCSTSNGTYTNVSGGSGATSTNYTTPALTNATNGDVTTYYECLITCTNGNATAIQTTPVAVTVHPTPTITISPTSESICYGVSAGTLTASNGSAGTTTYSWSPSTALSSSTVSNPTANPTVTTTYVVTGTANSCSATGTVVVTINPTPITVTPAVSAIASGGSQTITASATSANGPLTYEWSPCSSLSSSTGSSVTSTLTGGTTYTVTAIDGLGCTISATSVVNVIPAITTGQTSISCNYSSGVLLTGSSSSFSEIIGQSGTTTVATGSIFNTNYTSSFTGGFTFNYGGTSYSSVGINSNGFIYFGSGTPPNNETSAISDNTYPGTITGVISVLALTTNTNGGLTSESCVDATSGGSGNPGEAVTSISTDLTGTAPNRIFTIEWTGFWPSNISSIEECGFIGDCDPERMDCQIRLYENGGTNSNQIDLNFANQSDWCVAPGTTVNAQVGIRGVSNSDYLNMTENSSSGITSASSGSANTSTCKMESGSGLGGAYTSSNTTIRFAHPYFANTLGGSPNLCPGGSVALTAATGSSWQWYYNGSSLGSGATSQSYNVTSANPGIYVAFVTAASGCISSSYANIITSNSTVTPLVSIASSPSPLCAATSATFTATPTNAGCAPLYNWFLNGTQVGDALSTYTDNALNPNDYVSAVLNTNALCATSSTATSTTITNLASCAPTAYPVIPSTPSCGPATVGLSNSQTGDTYQLYLNGSTPIGSPIAGSTGSAIYFTATNPQNATGAYTVIGKDGSGNTTQMTSYAQVNAVPSTPAGFVNLSGCTSTGNINLTFTVTDPGPNFNVEWSTNGTSNNDGILGGGGGNLSKGELVLVGSPVTEYARLSDNTTGCKSAFISATATANPSPANPTGLSNQAVCTGSGSGNVTFTVTDPGSGYSIQWSTDGATNNDGTAEGGSGDLTNVKSVSLGSPIREYARTNNDATGCVSYWVSATGTANANPVPTYTTAPTPVCLNSTGNIYTTQSGQGNYQWSISGGTITSGGTTTDNTATVSWTTGGTGSISVNYTNSNECTAGSATPQSVTVNSLPTVSVTPSSSTTCSTDITQLTGNGAVTYSWAPSATLDNNTGTMVNASPATNTTYTVTGTDANGCTGTGTSGFTVKPVPTISVSPTDGICTGGTSITLTASGNSASYAWSPNTYLNVSTGTTVTAEISVLTFYTVTGTGSNGCTANGAAVPVATVPAGGSVLPVASVICSGGTKTLSASGTAGHDYQWEKSVDNINWTNISGATNTSYTTQSSDGTVKEYYRIVANSNSCWDVSSTTGIVDVSATPAITIVSVTSTTATITWSPYGTGQYNVSWSGAAGTGSANGVTTNTYQITSLSPNSGLLITVMAASPTCGGVSPGSASTSTLCGVPGSVTATAVAAPSHNITVSWSAVSGASAYRVYYRYLLASSSWSFTDVTGTSTTLTLPYGGATYAIYVAAKNCPTTGDFGDGSTVTYTTTNTIPTCSPIPTVTASSGCPNQITIGITGGSGSYAVSLREISPNLTAGASYNVSGSSLNITVGTQYAGSVWEIYARNLCSAGVYSALSDIAIVTVKPGCPMLNNLVLSHPSCSGFIASWNTDNCQGLGITSYQVLLKTSSALNYNGYSFSGSTDYAVVNWLNQNATYNVEIRSIACNGATSAASNVQTIQIAPCREQEQGVVDIPLTSTGNDQEAVAVYPNPTDGRFFVDIGRLDMSEATVKIELVNELGQVMQTSINTISGGHLNQLVTAPDGIATGVYFVRTTVGSNVYVSKLVIGGE